MDLEKREEPQEYPLIIEDPISHFRGGFSPEGSGGKPIPLDNIERVDIKDINEGDLVYIKRARLGRAETGMGETQDHSYYSYYLCKIVRGDDNKLYLEVQTDTPSFPPSTVREKDLKAGTRLLLENADSTEFYKLKE